MISKLVDRAPPIKVTYVTCVPLHTSSNGGSISCRNHLRRLADDEGIDLRAILIVPPEDAEKSRAALSEFGVQGEVLARNMNNCHPVGASFVDGLTFAYRIATKHHWELETMNQAAIQSAVRHLALSWGSDVVVFDYLFSALFAPSIFSEPLLKTVVVTHNSEAEFNRQMLAAGQLRQNGILGAISSRRLDKAERSLHRKADLVVAIGPDDVPTGANIVSTCITPILDCPDEPWTFDPKLAHDVLFLGNIGHFSNKVAIEWISTQLAPKVAVTSPQTRFRIVGASSDEVPVSWRASNVEFLGISDKGTTDSLLRSCGLSICPISNTFGAKFKLVEALAAGAPVLASVQSSRAVSYCRSLPTLDLSDAAAAAGLTAELSGNRERLQALSRAIMEEQRKFGLSQQGVWSRTLAKYLS